MARSATSPATIAAQGMIANRGVIRTSAEANPSPTATRATGAIERYSATGFSSGKCGCGGKTVEAVMTRNPGTFFQPHYVNSVTVVRGKAGFGRQRTRMAAIRNAFAHLQPM